MWIPASTTASTGSPLVDTSSTAAQVTRVKTAPVANVSQLTQKSPIKVQLIRTKDGIKLADKSFSESTSNLETSNTSTSKDFGTPATSFFAKPARTTTRILLRGHGQTPEADVELAGSSQPDFFIDSIDASIPLESSDVESRKTNVALSNAQFVNDRFSSTSHDERNVNPTTTAKIHVEPFIASSIDQNRNKNYQITFSSTDENWALNNSGLSTYSKSLPSSMAIGSQTRINEQDRANLPLVYFTAVDNVLEESVGGPVVGANSMHTMSLNELPHLSQKKNVQLKGLRKPCNCTRSMCLKLYCECFANGEFCKNCNCTNCKNVMTSENDRSRAIRSCLERNPMAFQPKIGKGRADTDRLHSKGCNCKKSSCLKNYCECYEAKVACTAKCKCVSCRNTETDRLHNKLTRPSLGLFAPSVLGAFGPEGDAATAWSNNQTSASTSRRLPLSLSPTSSLDRVSTTSDDATDEKFDLKKMPWYYLNDDVVQATTLCMVAQADQLENQLAVLQEIEDQVDTKQKSDDICIQKAVLREFGVCLQQIIQSTL